MSDIHVKVDDDGVVVPVVDQDTVKVVLATINQFLAVAEVVSKMTPTDKDDKLVAQAKILVAWLTPVVQQSWFNDVVSLLVKFLNKDKATQEELIKAVRDLV